MKRIVFLLFMVAVAVAAAQDGALAEKRLKHDTVVVGMFNYDLAMEILAETNRLRDSAGLAPLVMSRTLTETAMLRAAEAMPLLPHPYNSPHMRPNGDRYWTMLDGQDNCTPGGENINYGGSTVQRILFAWMHSEGHRKNIMNPEHKAIGIGAFRWYIDGKLAEPTCSLQIFTACTDVEEYQCKGKYTVKVRVTSREGERSQLLQRKVFREE